MIILLRYVFLAALIVGWIWTIVDVARTPAAHAQYLHKLIWLGFVVAFPVLGVPAWLLLGRPEPIGSRLVPQPPPSAPAPDDSPDFLRRVDEEIRRRRRAEQLRRERTHPADHIPNERVDEELRRLEEQFGDDPDEPTAT